MEASEQIKRKPGRPKKDSTSPSVRKAASEAIRTGMLVKLLQDHALGKVKLDAAKIKSIEVLLARTLPTLQSIEQTTIDARDKRSEDEILHGFKALVTSQPLVIERMIQVIAETDRHLLDRCYLSVCSAQTGAEALRNEEGACVTH